MHFSTASSSQRLPFKRNGILWMSLAAFTTVWIYTLVQTNDLNNWLLENLLVVVLLLALGLTYHRYRFSDLSYVLIALFLVVHVYGSTYTYAENPLGDWIKQVLHWKRNPYDRLVHFSFGLLLAYPAREWLLTVEHTARHWAYWIPVGLGLLLGAGYELMEWLVADVFFSQQGPAYLGTQGDVWDAQKDMALGLAGAAIAMGLTFLSVERERE